MTWDQKYRQSYRRLMKAIWRLWDFDKGPVKIVEVTIRWQRWVQRMIEPLQVD